MFADEYKALAEVSAFGFTLVMMLYYLNQSLKRSGYVPAKWILGLTMGESTALVGLFYFAPLAFKVVVAMLGLTTAVVMFHAAVKDKAMFLSENPNPVSPSNNNPTRTVPPAFSGLNPYDEIERLRKANERLQSDNETK